MMIDSGVDVYEGMIIGEHTRDNDLEVNPVKGKQLTNIRTHSKDEAVELTTPKKLTLEQSLGYIADDEYVEVTPKSIRLRKIWLDPNEAASAPSGPSETAPRTVIGAARSEFSSARCHIGHRPSRLASSSTSRQWR